MAFKDDLIKALRETGAPSWETKKRVPANHQARLIVTPEIRDIVKTVAERNRTGMATVVWFAMFILWKYLEYSPEEFSELTVKSIGD